MGALGPLYTYTYTALFGAFWACFCFGLSMGKEGKSLSVFWREQSEPPASHRLPSAIIRYCSSLYRQWASCVKFLCQVPSTPTGPLAAPRVDSPRTDSHLCLCAKRPARSGTRQRSVKRRCGTRTPSPHALESSLPPPGSLLRCTLRIDPFINWFSQSVG